MWKGYLKSCRNYYLKEKVSADCPIIWKRCNSFNINIACPKFFFFLFLHKLTSITMTHILIRNRLNWWMNDTKSIMVLFLVLAEISTLTLLVEMTKGFDLEEQELSCVNEQKMNHYLGNTDSPKRLKTDENKIKPTHYSGSKQCKQKTIWCNRTLRQI